MKIQNTTSCPHRAVFVYGPRGAELLVLAFKASFRLSATGVRHPSPVPIFLAEVSAPSGALLHPSDVAFAKRGTDIIVRGSVYSPGGALVERCYAGLQVGALGRTIAAIGRRRWVRWNGRLTPSRPEPFLSLPLGFELAFGGPDEARNPIGVGTPREGQALPCLEDPSTMIASEDDRPEPAALGPVASHWLPRRSFAGTYDDAWKRRRAPFLPDDFDARFFQVAPSGLTSARPLRGGEAVRLVNLTPSGLVETAVPRLNLRVQVDRDWVVPALDLVTIEPDEDRISVTLRATIDVTDRLDDLPRVRVFERRLVPLGGEARA